MKCTEDFNRFDELLNVVTSEIVNSIKSDLEHAGIGPDKLEELTSNIAFGVGAIIDGSRVMYHKGKKIQPFLAFEITEGELLHSGGSWIHEYTMGWVEAAFEDKS